MSLSDFLVVKFQDRLASEEQRRGKAKKNDGIFLAAIRNRLASATNSNTAVTGEPGIGKSTLSLVSAEKLKPEIFIDHPEEAVEKFVTFTASSFMRAIRDSPRGSVIIGDEFGQQMHHRKFMRDENVALSNSLQGFRFKEFISFMNAPGLRYFDVDAQGLLTWMITVDRRGHAQIYRVSHPKFSGSDYYQTFVDDFEFGMPRPGLWGAYKAAKEENQAKVFDDSIRLTEKAERVPLTIEDMVKMINEKPDDYKKEWGGVNRYHAATIEGRFDIGHSVSSRIIAKLNKEKPESQS